jgi:Carboxypeptidase regulatory-like domain
MRSDRRGAMNRPVFGLSAALVALVLIGGCNPQLGASSPIVPSASSAATATPATASVHGKAVAGPTCPVEPAFPSPGQCEPRVVSGAVLVITDAGGHEVTRVTSTADGTFTVNLPAGTYTLTPQAVVGLMGAARPMEVTVPTTGVAADLLVQYDTGIR